MAPELRKRKAAPEAQKSNGTPVKSAAKQTKTKRKATEDASPVSLKKQKPTKKTEVAEKPKKAAKKATKKAPVEKEVEDEPVDDKSEPEEQEEDGGVLLLADELDSGDEEGADEAADFKPGQDVGKVPTISKEVMKAAKAPTGERGVIYIGRIPHGFYEHEMRQYLTQFGPITRLRLSRNKKTGASKHFAFVEFEEATTAEIVAKTMDNYLLFGHILKVKVVPKSQVHENLFKGANRRFKKVPWNKMAGQKLAKPLTESAWASKVERERENRAKKAEKLKALGYDFEAPALKEAPAPLPLENGEAEPKAIEAAPAADEAEKEAETEEPEPEVKTISAPKPKVAKAKASKAGKGKKSKA
ncbi:RNA recognition motif domain-containingprotein [Purpureocillium lavendulum]|uniref:RNA recognition motif domain-containingprotein n=1 Tax=Purpureocillium lavendulum TaxID=1247861 RepID=A0AB34FRI0_9HYPO|nr:RNA recognition motif domain-containingprotein [Purpureocillium lavendulum]